MYTYLSATGTVSDFGSRPKLVDISAMPLNQVFKTYAEITVTLVRASDNREVYLDLYQLPVPLRMISQTLPQWLIINANNTLPTVDVPIDADYVYVRYHNLWRTGFDIQTSNHTMHPDMDLADEQKPDIIVKKDQVNYKQMVESGLFTVNGYIHQADYHPNGVFVLNANKNRAISKENQVGYLNFSQIGKIHYVPILEDMIYSRSTKPLNDALYLKLPFLLGNYIPLVIIAGRMFYPDGIVRIVGDNTIKIDFSSVALEKWFYEDKDQIDLSHLNVSAYQYGQYDLSGFYTDEYLKRLVTHPLSCIVLVETNELRSGRIELDPAQLQGRFISTLDFDAPIVDEQGRLRDYVTEVRGDRKVIRLIDYLRKNLVLDTTPYLNYESNVDIAVSAQPYTHIRGHYWILSKTRGV